MGFLDKFVPKPSEEFENPDKFEDCLSCRVFGSTALTAAGGYVYFSGMKQLRESRRKIELSTSRYKYGSRQLGIILLSAAFVGMGLYRTVN